MNFRKNSTLIVGCAVAFVLLIVAVVFLVRNQASYTSNLNELNAARNRLNILNERNPYPSAENVKLASENLEVLKSKYLVIQESLMENQLKAESIEPAQFAPLLEAGVQRIRERASANNVSLPVEAGLGFKEYAAGKLPPNNPKVMERLIIQVKALADILGILIDSKVASIDTLQRDDFEIRLGDAAATPPPEEVGRRGIAAGRGEALVDTRASSGTIPPAATNSLYETERFTIGFTGRESAVWEALNRFVSSKIVYVIKDINIESTLTNVGKPVDMKARLAAIASATSRQAALSSPSTGVSPAGGALPALDSVSREERVVGGRELIKVKVVVDMYRFKDPSAGEVQP